MIDANEARSRVAQHQERERLVQRIMDTTISVEIAKRSAHGERMLLMLRVMMDDDDIVARVCERLEWLGYRTVVTDLFVVIHW